MTKKIFLVNTSNKQALINLLCQPNNITLGLYNDDMETVNPLGSHTTVHRLDFFYYIVKELPPEYNSQLDNCHLLQIYYSADRKKYGFSKILIHIIIVEQLKSLEKDTYKCRWCTDFCQCSFGTGFW